jgi:succinate dehydrogenase / fumarate reductase flavoprotein subunit
MDVNVGVFRTGQELSQGLEKIRSLRRRYSNISIEDQSAVYNTNLYHALEIANLLDLAEVMVTGAVTRTESRGGHARRDFPVRDDEHWLKHTLAFFAEQGPKLDYKPVTITTWQPVERKY